MTPIFIASLIGAGLTILNQTLIRKKIWWGYVGMFISVGPFAYINWTAGAYGYLFILGPFYLYTAVQGIRQWRTAEKGGPSAVAIRSPKGQTS